MNKGKKRLTEVWAHIPLKRKCCHKNNTDCTRIMCKFSFLKDRNKRRLLFGTATVVPKHGPGMCQGTATVGEIGAIWKAESHANVENPLIRLRTV